MPELLLELEELFEEELEWDKLELEEPVLEELEREE